MSEIRYMISDASRQVGVETHVLRSWEEELEIEVGRTELGHRYYTDKTIYVMKKVKELREKGFQLKAIKVLIPEIQKKSESNEKNKTEETNETETKVGTLQEITKEQECIPLSVDIEKLSKFEDIVSNIVKRTLQENNAELEERIADTILQEITVMNKIQEKREEERYRRLDETIRAFQYNRQIVAATKEKATSKKWFQIFR